MRYGSRSRLVGVDAIANRGGLVGSGLDGQRSQGRIGGGAVFALAQDDDGGHRSRGHDDAFDIDANHANLQMCTASCGR